MTEQEIESASEISNLRSELQAPKYVCLTCNKAGLTRNEACPEQTKDHKIAFIAPGKAAMQGVVMTLICNVTSSAMQFVAYGHRDLDTFLYIGHFVQLLPLIIVFACLYSNHKFRSMGVPAKLVIPVNRAMCWGVASVYLVGLGLLLLGHFFAG